MTDHSSAIGRRRRASSDVAREREVEEREDAGRGDADRQDPRAGAVAEAALVGCRSPAAPRARSRARAQPPTRTRHIVHGNGERISTTSPCCGAARMKRPLRPVVDVAGRVAEVLPVGAAGHVRHAPQRLARDRDEQLARARRAPSRRRCPRDRARARAPRSRVAMSNSLSANGMFSAFITGTRGSARARSSHSACSCGSSRSIPTMRRSPRLLRPLVREHALAAADVEHRRGEACATARRACARSPSSAAGRPGSSSRTCRTCCR